MFKLVETASRKMGLPFESWCKCILLSEVLAMEMVQRKGRIIRKTLLSLLRFRVECILIIHFKSHWCQFVFSLWALLWDIMWNHYRNGTGCFSQWQAPATSDPAQVVSAIRGIALVCFLQTLDQLEDSYHSLWFPHNRRASRSYFLTAYVHLFKNIKVFGQIITVNHFHCKQFWGKKQKIQEKN